MSFILFTDTLHRRSVIHAHSTRPSVHLLGPHGALARAWRRTTLGLLRLGSRVRAIRITHGTICGERKHTCGCAGWCTRVALIAVRICVARGTRGRRVRVRVTVGAVDLLLTLPPARGRNRRVAQVTRVGTRVSGTARALDVRR
jgi:hypothetical protein